LGLLPRIERMLERLRPDAEGGRFTANAGAQTYLALVVLQGIVSEHVRRGVVD
jgi:hypothetical protein